jgi:hypothetical protein
MSNKVNSRVELAAYIAIIIMALVSGTVLVKRFLIDDRQGLRDPRVAVGTKVSLPGLDWSGHKRTLILAVSAECRYCTESAPFYRKLSTEASDLDGVGLVAVLPQPVDEARRYLDELHVPMKSVSGRLDTLGVSATPTLLLVDSQGAVQKSWVGKLPVSAEAEVLAALKD